MYSIRIRGPFLSHSSTHKIDKRVVPCVRMFFRNANIVRRIRDVKYRLRRAPFVIHLSSVYRRNYGRLIDTNYETPFELFTSGIHYENFTPVSDIHVYTQFRVTTEKSPYETHVSYRYYTNGTCEL